MARLSAAIHANGAEAYDHLQAEMKSQGLAPDAIAHLDDVAMKLLEEFENVDEGGLTLRFLNGDDYRTMTILGGARD